MRFIVTLILVLLTFTSNANITYQKLCEVNKVWLEQDLTNITLPAYSECVAPFFSKQARKVKGNYL